VIIQSVYIIAQLALATSHPALIFFKARVPFPALADAHQERNARENTLAGVIESSEEIIAKVAKRGGLPRF